MIAMTNSVDMEGYQVKNLGIPTDPNDAVSKSFAEQLLNNRSWKDPVRVAVATNVNIASPGASQDGVAITIGEALVLYGQNDQAQNGVYVFNGASSPLTRRADADTGEELRPGTTFIVTEGTSADRYAILISDGTITVGTTALQFVIMSNTGQVFTATNGAQLVNGVFSILLDSASGLIATASGLKIDPSVVGRKFAANVGNASATLITVTHNLGNKDVLVGLYENATDRDFFPDVKGRTVNSFTLEFGTAPGTNAFRVIAHG